MNITLLKTSLHKDTGHIKIINCIFDPKVDYHQQVDYLFLLHNVIGLTESDVTSYDDFFKHMTWHPRV